MTSGTRVLVAEDQEDVRAALADLIAGEPSLELVGTVADAHGAIRVAQAARPDVALVDVKMPGGGPYAAREICRLSPATRVVALSAYDDRETVLAMLRAGAVAYLVKGASIDEILETIRRSVRGQGALSAEITSEVIEELATKLRSEERDATQRREQVERIEAVLRDGSLSVVFQPIVDLTTRSPAGMEALTRFRANGSEKTPDAWFEEAAAVGLGVDLELAAVRSAVASAELLPADVAVSVNLSPSTALSRGLRDALAEAPLDRLILEITEHAHVDDYQALADALRGMRASGVRVAVDDAGAGFASLRHILHLAPDFIKLDISLTRGIDTDRAHRALGAALISFAGEIDAQIIAEGVETEAEVEALQSLGVRLGQGYHLARPAPVSATGGPQLAASP